PPPKIRKSGFAFINSPVALGALGALAELGPAFPSSCTVSATKVGARWLSGLSSTNELTTASVRDGATENGRTWPQLSPFRRSTHFDPGTSLRPIQSENSVPSTSSFSSVLPSAYFHVSFTAVVRFCVYGKPHAAIPPSTCRRKTGEPIGSSTCCG